MIRHRNLHLGLFLALIFLAPVVIFNLWGELKHFYSLIFLLILGWISWIDIDRFKIPNTASILLVSIGAVRIFSFPLPVIYEHVFTSVTWCLMFYIVSVLFLRAKGFEGLGFGDVKLIAGLGLWLGFSATQYTILAACISAILFILISSLIKKKTRQESMATKMPLGAFLTFFAWLFHLSASVG